MQTVKIIQTIIMISLLSILAACGNRDDGQLQSSPTTLSGRVADGYLSGARVFLDRNGNRSLDAGEPWDLSTTNGQFTLQVGANEGNLYPVVAEIIAGQTIDEDQPQQGIADSYRLEAPAGKWSFISPLTTMVKNELAKNPTLTLSAAEDQVRTQLGLGSGDSLFTDYMGGQNANALAAHHAARIIAGVMGPLQTRIVQNIGPSMAEEQKKAVALIIDDQIKDHRTVIAQRLAEAGDDALVEAAKAEILEAIDTSGLDAQLLDRYIDRMQHPSPVWDMTEPKLLSQTPAANGAASIDVVITLGFDEDIDPTSIMTDSLQLTGPNGPLSGTISYDPATRQLEFIPESYLVAFTSYQVDLAGITDNSGNPLQQPLGWEFTTIFDQLPPALPDF